jgi:hypothetical protein
MKLSKTIAALCLSTISVTSFAFEVGGELVVERDMPLKTRFLGRARALPAGTYNAEIENHSVLNHLTLEVNGKSYQFKYPSSLDVPFRNGALTIAGDSNSQGIDVKYDVHTTEHAGPQYDNTVSCVYDTVTRERWVIRPCPETGHPESYRETYREDIYGHQLLRQHDVTYYSTFKVKFEDYASFVGKTRDSETITDRTGRCYR